MQKQIRIIDLLNDKPQPPVFEVNGLKTVLVKENPKTWIYVPRDLNKTQVKERIDKYLERARQCEREYINRNGGRPGGSYEG